MVPKESVLQDFPEISRSQIPSRTTKSHTQGPQVAFSYSPWWMFLISLFLWKWRNGPGIRGVHFGIASGWGGHLRRSGVHGAYGASHPSWGGAEQGPGEVKYNYFFGPEVPPCLKERGSSQGLASNWAKKCDKTREKTPKGLMVPVSRGHTPPPPHFPISLRISCGFSPLW